MTPPTPTGEADRPRRRRLSIRAAWISGVVAATGIGGTCAWLAGQTVLATIWDEGQALVAAKWCLGCYLASSLAFTAILFLDRDDSGGNGDKAGVTIFAHLILGALSFPLGFAGGYVGKLVGAIVGVFTAPFGSTWLDDAVSTSGQGCLIGVIGGVMLPWLILLKGATS
jgi:hypothetical protein